MRSAAERDTTVAIRQSSVVFHPRRRQPRQSTSIAYTDAVAEIKPRLSIGTVGDSYDAMAESVNALYKTELHRSPVVHADKGGHWRGLDDLEIATCAWVSWFNEERLRSELDDATPAEVEAAHYAALGQANVA